MQIRVRVATTLEGLDEPETLTDAMWRKLNAELIGSETYANLAGYILLRNSDTFADAVQSAEQDVAAAFKELKPTQSGWVTAAMHITRVDAVDISKSSRKRG